ncbi:hypothetical protein LO772_06625 [Yinghuangia sp. ASG 101]|uniref:hypothetical protein n=1 Tax=Yinghuangia sp. ASG 101 TaxID=2896848 RepID=UPI001E37CF35|nr:hypothetical protein [Yinghuangia sp. ASG 101]UGQ13285.1 hypothetical protein LO772_06625 [Yinghuangia sp. ASG 101]
MTFAVAACFGALAVLTLIAASTGYRGLVCDAERGYRVPAHVAGDPHLTERANQSVAFWCTGASLLSAAPLVPLLPMLADGAERRPTVPSLAVLAAYGVAVVALGRVPFALIRRYTPVGGTPR